MNAKTHSMKKIPAFLLALVIALGLLLATPGLTAFAAAGPEPLEYSNLALTPGSDESELLLSWYSPSATGGIVYNLQGDSNTQTVASTVTARAAHNVHKATVSGLVPSSTYEYKLLGADNAESATFTFDTGAADTFSFLAVGDIQIGSSGNAVNDTNGWVNTLNIVTASFPNLSFIASAGDQVETANRQNEYNGVLTPSQLSGLPMAPAVGNHDSGNQLFRDHFNLPNVYAHNTGATQFDYSFRYGNALFIYLDNSTSITSARRANFESVVAANADAEWKFVVFHYAPYSVYRSDTDGNKVALINNWIPVFDAQGIDAVINGHCHSYARSYQMEGNIPLKEQEWIDAEGKLQTDATGKEYNAVLNPTGTVYFTLNSSSGSKFYSPLTERYHSAAYSQTSRPSFSVADVSDEAFTFSTYQINANGTTTEIDTYTIIKSDNYSPPARVKADISVDPVTDVEETVDYTVSMMSLEKVMTVGLTFEVDGSMLAGAGVEALNGFTALDAGSGAVRWTSLGNDVWQGELTLMYLNNNGFISEVSKDIVKVLYAAKQLGDATMKLTGLTASGIDKDGKVVYFDSALGTAEATTTVENIIVYSIYDLNKDGVVDQLDLTIAQLYYQVAEGDANWGTAKIADVNEDGVVNMLDLVAIFINYTR